MLFTQKSIHAAVLFAAGTIGALTLVGPAYAAQGQGRPPAEVTVITVKAEPVQIDTVLTGRTSAYSISEVRPQVNGILQKRFFQEGQEVKAGDQLYQIDPAIYEAQLKTAQAGLAQARATLSRALADAKRSAELVKVQAVSKQSDDAAQAALRTAQAGVQSGEAAVLTAKINLDYTKVRSPISGRVSRSEFTEGALLSGYQSQALTSVQQLDPIYVDVTQSAEELLRLQREIASGVMHVAEDGSAAVKVSFSDGTTYGETGRLTFTDSQVDESTGTVKLRAVFPNPKHQLLPGMFVRAAIVEGVRPDAILVRMQSVMRDQRGNAYVYVVGADNKVESRTVTLGKTIGQNWLVTAGLKDGERVMFEGFQRTAPGATVVAKEFDPKSAPAGDPLF